MKLIKRLKTFSIKLFQDLKTQKNVFSLKKIFMKRELENTQKASPHFYFLGQLFFSLGDYHKAKEFYHLRIKQGGSNDEIYYSLFQIGIIALHFNDSEETIRKIFTSCYQFRPTRAEALYQLTIYYRSRKQFEAGYTYAKNASKICIPEEDDQFVSKDVYDYQIWQELALCAFETGRFKETLEITQGLLANPTVPKSEHSRLRLISQLAQKRIEDLLLQKNEPSISDIQIGTPFANIEKNLSKHQKPIAQVVRFGGLGDILMATAIFPGLKSQGYRIRMICSPLYAPLLEDNPYIDELWTNIEQPIPKLKENDRHISLGYPGENGEPPPLDTEHITTIFSKIAGVPVSDELYVALSEEHHQWAQKFSNALLIQTKTGWSPYKDWPTDRWSLLCQKLKESFDIDIYQIGASSDPSIPGIEKVNNPSIRHAIAAVQHSRLLIGLDSLFNHASRAVKKPALIIWGSTHPQIAGYAQNINLVNGMVWEPEMENYHLALRCQPCFKSPLSPSSLPCLNTVPCTSQSTSKEGSSQRVLQACMNGNTVDIVYHYAAQMLTQSKEEPNKKRLQEVNHAD